MDLTANQNYPYSETFERIMATMDRLSKKHEQNKLDYDRMNEFQEETNRKFVELARQSEKTDKKMKRISRDIGSLHNSFGELAEHLVAPNIVKKFQAIGFKVEKWCKNVEIFTPDLTKIITEIDIFIENGDTAIVVEVKSKVREKHLQEFINKMKKFREYSDRKQDKRIFLGAIAAAIIEPKQRNEILSEGIYLIEQTGDTMKITMSEDFMPKHW